MSSLEELAAALLGEDTQKVIATQNPYYALQAVPEQIGGLTEQLVTQAPTRFSAKEYLPWAVGSGLLSGLLGSAGQDYQNTLTGRYLQAAMGQKPQGYLPSGLFGSAARQGGLFSMINDIKDQEALRLGLTQGMVDTIKNRNDMQKAVLEALSKANTPRAAGQVLSAAKAMGINVGDSAPSALPSSQGGPIATTVKPEEEEIGPELPLKTMRDVESDILRQKIDEEGIPPGAAQEAATKYTNELRQRNKALFGDKLKEQQETVSKIEELVRSGEEGIEKAGKTGSGLASAYEGTLAWLDQYTGKFPEAREQAAGDQLLKTTKQLGAAINRIVGSGALSYFESRALFETAMSPTNTQSQNKILLKKYENGLALVKEHNDFMNYVLDRYGGSPTKAQALWEAYKRDQPILVKEGKEYVINDKRTPWQKFDFANAYKRMMSGELPTTMNVSDDVTGLPVVGNVYQGQKVISVKKIK